MKIRLVPIGTMSSFGSTYIAVSTVRALAVMNEDGSEPTVIWTAPNREGIDDPDWGPNP